VSEELLSNDMERVTGNDLTVERRPIVDTVDLRREIVTNDLNALTNILNDLELLNKPLDLAVRIILIRIGVQVKAHGVAKFGINRDDAKTRRRIEGVKFIVHNGIAGQSTSPVIRQGVV
jgi:hypothetical protein